MWRRHSSFYYFTGLGMAIIMLVGITFQIRSPKVYYVFFGAWSLLFLTGKYALRKRAEKRAMELKAERQAWIDDIKLRGEAIVVALPQCRIVSNAYTVEHEGSADERMNVDLPSVAYHNVRKEYVARSVVVYERMRNGIKEVYESPVLPIDEVSLSFLFEAQKQTTLYVAGNTYYFDLEFLRE